MSDKPKTIPTNRWRISPYPSGFDIQPFDIRFINDHQWVVLASDYDALAARLAEAERERDALKETRIRELTYVIAEAKRTLVLNEIETREALDDLRAWAVNRKDAIINAALERTP